MDIDGKDKEPARTSYWRGKDCEPRNFTRKKSNVKANWGKNFDVLLKKDRFEKWLVVLCTECNKFYNGQPVSDPWVNNGSRTRKLSDAQDHLKSELHLRMLRTTAATPAQGTVLRVHVPSRVNVNVSCAVVYICHDDIHVLIYTCTSIANCLHYVLFVTCTYASTPVWTHFCSRQEGRR